MNPIIGEETDAKVKTDLADSQVASAPSFITTLRGDIVSTIGLIIRRDRKRIIMSSFGVELRPDVFDDAGEAQAYLDTMKQVLMPSTPETTEMTITSLVPATGPAGQTTDVVLTGTNLSQNDLRLTIGGEDVGFTADFDAGTMTFPVPGNIIGPYNNVSYQYEPGAVDVTIESVLGQSVTKTGGFTYTVEDSPTLTACLPTASPSGVEGTTIILYGTNLLPGGKMTFDYGQGDAVDVYDYSVDYEASTITCILPSTISAKTIGIKYTNYDTSKTATLDGVFSFT